MLRRFFNVVCLAAVLLVVPVKGTIGNFIGATFADAAMVLCTKGSSTTRTDCIPLKAPNVNFHGDQQHNDYVPILVCHSWWNKLWGDPVKRTRWWGPTNEYRRTGWKANLAAVYQPCKWFWPRVGAEITTEVSCCSGALATTGPVTRAMAGKRVDLYLRGGVPCIPPKKKK